MNKLAVSLAVVKEALRTNPAVTAALVNFALVALAHFGLNVTVDQLIAFVGFANVLFGLLVRANVVPLTKLDVTIEPKTTITHNGPH